MPLVPGKSRAAIGKNIEIEGAVHPEMPQKQKVAIALSEARKYGAKIPKPPGKK